MENQTRKNPEALEYLLSVKYSRTVTSIRGRSDQHWRPHAQWADTGIHCAPPHAQCEKSKLNLCDHNGSSIGRRKGMTQSFNVPSPVGLQRTWLFVGKIILLAVTL